jgi:hypothetical protein
MPKREKGGGEGVKQISLLHHLKGGVAMTSIPVMPKRGGEGRWRIDYGKKAETHSIVWWWQTMAYLPGPYLWGE